MQMKIKDLLESGRPPKTSAREDRVLVCEAKRLPTSSGTVLRHHRHIDNRVSLSTIKRRLIAEALRARGPTRRPLLSCLEATRNILSSAQHPGTVTC